MHLPQNIKDSLYTEIYFQHYEPNIIAYLKSNTVWDYLLSTNNIDLIKFWLNLNYSNNDLSTLNYCDYRSDIQLLLSNLKIDNEMLASVDSSNAMPFVKNLILDYMSRYVS